MQRFKFRSNSRLALIMYSGDDTNYIYNFRLLSSHFGNDRYLPTRTSHNTSGASCLMVFLQKFTENA